MRTRPWFDAKKRKRGFSDGGGVTSFALPKPKHGSEKKRVSPSVEKKEEGRPTPGVRGKRKEERPFSCLDLPQEAGQKHKKRVWLIYGHLVSGKREGKWDRGSFDRVADRAQRRGRRGPPPCGVGSSAKKKQVSQFPR